MNRGRVLVTPRSMSTSLAPSVHRLTEAGYEVVTPSPGRQPTAEELITAVPGAVGWIAGVEPISAEILMHADRLQVISRNGAGCDAIDTAAAADAGVAVLTARGANARGVAELALSLMIAGLRGIPASSAALRSGHWERRTGKEIEGRTLGVVGYGAIGATLAGFATTLGMRVIAYDPYVTETPVPLVGLEELLEQSAVVSLHVPPTGDGPLLDAARLSLLDDDVILLNTARSTLVDESALLTALEGGRIALYTVDAFDTEPPPPSDLLRHPRVVPTPHLGAATEESSRRAADAAVENLLAYLG